MYVKLRLDWIILGVGSQCLKLGWTRFIFMDWIGWDGLSLDGIGAINVQPRYPNIENKPHSSVG